jgi:hypothetical protein
MDEQWYVYDAGTTHGPMPLDAVRAWVADGRLSPLAAMRTPESQSWSLVTQVLGLPAPAARDPTDDYQRVAEALGMVPDVSRARNRMQAICVGMGALIGLVVGGVYGLAKGGGYDLMIWGLVGLAGGLVVATIGSGLVLCISGLRRK